MSHDVFQRILFESLAHCLWIEDGEERSDEEYILSLRDLFHTTVERRIREAQAEGKLKVVQ